MEIEEDNSRKSNGNRLSITERWKIIGYFECCQSQSKTADHFNVNQSTVSRILSKVEVQKDVKDYQKFGRFEILKAEDESVIEEMIEENKMVTLQQIADTLDVNRCTALKKMHEIGLNFSLPNKVPQLNSLHIQKRLNHCTSLKDKNTDNIIFTDETYLQLYRNTLGNWHFSDDNFVSIPQTRVCLMAYGCICESGKSEIFIYEKGFQINSEAYCSVLEKILIPFAEKEFTKKTRKSKSVSQWYLLQDNAPCHNSKFTKAFLKSNSINTLSHPPNSPDLNPIELVWAILKRKVERMQPKNQEQLQQTIIECWESIEQKQIKSCIQHFQKRIQEVYSLNGRFY
ncbi:hypothetical protein ABPG72_002490 [Tetrahymena utriculariae]